MCTVSYLPLKEGFILTSNRDEAIKRLPALPIQEFILFGQKLNFPKDPVGGGTWIANGSNGFTVCLLNGADYPHQSTGNYRRSRGLVVLDFFEFDSVQDFILKYDFNNIEPFTLIFIETVMGLNYLSQLKWDGNKPKHTFFDSDHPRIWSSVTLYSSKDREEKEAFFYEWVKSNSAFSVKKILKFHRIDYSNTNSMILTGPLLQTVSITCISKLSNEIHFYYEDRILKTKSINRIPS